MFNCYFNSKIAVSGETDLKKKWTKAWTFGGTKFNSDYNYSGLAGSINLLMDIFIFSHTWLCSENDVANDKMAALSASSDAPDGHCLGGCQDGQAMCPALGGKTKWIVHLSSPWSWTLMNICVSKRELKMIKALARRFRWNASRTPRFRVFTVEAVMAAAR